MMPKFRVWDRNREEMLYSDCDDPNKLLIYWDFRNNAWLATRAKDGFVLGKHNADLMYYTGIKDKNGKEIYEGDIVRIKYEAIISWLSGKIKEFDAIGKVIFLNEDYRSGRKMSEFVIKTSTNWIRFFNCRSIEVIGNIYENPELLKG